ncbi:DUF1902 domain-containing protein [Aquisalinus flavus]|nr:DUF1902 domain-containing protein [Aquisalinus flavus]
MPDKKSFRVTARWDDEAKVFYSDSNINGLHIEAETLEEFEALIFDTAVDLVLANHFTPAELASKPLRELLPTILWEKPEAVSA